MLPAGPRPSTTLPNMGHGEDFDFDGEGRHVSMAGGRLVARTIAGQQTLLAAGFTSETNGTRILPDGTFVVAERGTNSLKHIDPVTGGSITLLGNLSYPNGVEVTRDGRYVFVTENALGTLVQVELANPTRNVVATGITGANSIILSPDEQTAFVGTCAGTGVVAMQRLGDAAWGVPQVVVDRPATCIDALNVDACGNIYWANSLNGKITRVLADGSQSEEVLTIPGLFVWLPNMRWGHGIGGWETDVLYVADLLDGAVHAVEIGVEGKRHVLAP